MLVAGDFNHPDISWNSEGGICSLNRFASANDFLDSINSKFIIQNVYQPTFGNNTLDLVLTEHPNRIFVIKTEPPISSSTHDRLHVVLTWDYELNNRNKIGSDEAIYKLDIKKSNTEKISEYISKIDWENEFRGLDADLMYEKFVEHYLISVDKFTPKIAVKKHRRDKPKWMTDELKKLTKLKSSLCHKMLAASTANKLAINVKYKSLCKLI